MTCFLQRWRDSLPLFKSPAAESIRTCAGGRVLLQNHGLFLTTSGVHVWFIAAWQTWGKMTVGPAGIFMSSAYKADFAYYGKSSKNSWNWRYAVWLPRAGLVFQPSEIFLNFATQPSLLPITSPCRPARSSLQIFFILLLRERETGKKQRSKRNEGKEAAPGCSAEGWKCLKLGIWVAWFPGLECGRQERSSLSSGMLLASAPPSPCFRSHFQGSSPSISAPRPGLDMRPGSFLLLLWAQFVNLKMRLGEQMQKHRRGATSLVFTLTFSLYGSSFLLFLPVTPGGGWPGTYSHSYISKYKSAFPAKRKWTRTV